MVSEAAVQIANRNGNPIQLFPVLLMMAWMTLGPIMEEARLERPNSPKNCNAGIGKSGMKGEDIYTYHVVKARGS